MSSRDVPHITRLLSSGDLPGMGSFVVVSPVGKHVGADTPAGIIAQVALDIACSIQRMWVAASTLHGDVSANNILVTTDGRGLLVDFGSALVGPGSCGKQRVTGTVLFSAFSVLWGECNTVSSDLESLFYSLLYMALDGEVCWKLGQERTLTQILPSSTPPSSMLC